MIRTMARVTDVHQAADEEDGVELPAKIVNEDLRRFFMPKKYAEPEPVPEPVPEAEKVEAKAVEEPIQKEEPESSKHGAKSPVAAPAAPVELLRKSEQLAQSPKSAYAPGAFDPRAPIAPKTSPSKSGSKWWRLGSRKSRMAKESAPASAAAPKPVRFREKHAYNTPSARELLEGERPLQPTPGEAHAEVVPHAEEDPQAPEAAPAAKDKAIDAPAAEEATPAAQVPNLAPAASAASGDPIAEAVVALQQVLEPEPVPEVPAPAPEEEAVKEAEPEEATVTPAEEKVKKEATPVETAPVQIAPIEAPVPKEEETLPEPEAAQADEAAPAEAPAEASAHKDDLPEAAQVEEPAALVLPSKSATEVESVHMEEKPEDIAEHKQAQAETEEAAAAVEPEQAPAAVEPEEALAAVEDPAAETEAAERKAITMGLTVSEDAAEERPVTCNFKVDEGALPTIAENGALSTHSSPQKEMPINAWYRKGERKAGKKGRGLFSCFACFGA